MDVGVVGGGAAGMLAAIELGRGGVRTSLFDGNSSPGRKLFITGKGRCNLTNDCDAPEALKNVVHGEKFLRSAIYSFPPSEVKQFFEELGVELCTERGRRVFPASGKSSDVIRALERELKRLNTDIHLNESAIEISSLDGKFELVTSRGAYVFDKIIIATGGASYPSTGSTGDGYAFARSFGHSVLEPRPALAPLKVKENIGELSGLALKNVRLTAYHGDKEIASEFGELELMSDALGGPIALTVSSYAARLDGVRLSLDLKPALDLKTLDARLVREFSSRQNEEISSVMRALLPEKLNGYVLKRAGIGGRTAANSVTREQRQAIAKAMKSLDFCVRGAAPFSEAIITSGGVDVKQLRPSGESRLVPGLYFAGEVADVDALTGGFNLQIAWSMAHAAARSILSSSDRE